MGTAIACPLSLNTNGRHSEAARENLTNCIQPAVRTAALSPLHCNGGNLDAYTE
jgi:hypothetical protein